MKVEQASLGRDMTASVNNLSSRWFVQAAARRAVCRQYFISDPACQRSAIMGLADENVVWKLSRSIRGAGVPNLKCDVVNMA
jgi:hypothetical protein